MATSRVVREFRCDDVLRDFSSCSDCVFFTLTTPDVVGIREIRSRWRNFRNFFVRDYERRFGRRPRYVMNYELHPGALVKESSDGSVFRGDGVSHGWHVHGLFDCYVPLSVYLPRLRCYGFGRVDVRRVTSVGVSRYLTKHALKAYRGVRLRDVDCGRLRLVNTSRGLPRLADYAVESDYKASVTRVYNRIRHYKLCRGLSFLKVYQLASLAVMLDVTPAELPRFLYHCAK